MKLIGRGLFTKCYLNSDNITVTLHSYCYAKECAAFRWFPESYLFAPIERVDRDGDGLGIYSMDYYPRGKGLKGELEPRQWQLYSALRELKARYKKEYDASAAWHAELNKLPDEFAEEREALKGALDAMGNYGSDVSFEISPRNVRAHENKLVLLDCFFVISQVNEFRKGRR